MTTRSPTATPATAGARRQHLADDLVAEHARQLARDVRLADVRAADAAGEHAADDLARPGDRIGELLDDHLARGQRPRDLIIAASTAAERRRQQPEHRLARRRRGDPALGDERRDERRRRHVEGRVAARRVRRPSAARRPRGGPRRRRAPRSRSRRRSRSTASIVEVGPATTNGIPAACAASACAYVPTLLATSPLAATRSQPTITASTSPRRMSPAAAPSTSSSCGMPARRSSQIVSRAPCSSGRVSQASTDSSPRARELDDDGQRRAACRRTRACPCCSA